MPRLRPTNLDHGGQSDVSFQAAADGMVSGLHDLMTTETNRMSARQLEDQLGVTYKTAWLLTQKLRRSMVDPDREPLEGVVEVEQAEIPFRKARCISSSPAMPAKSSSSGPSRVIDRDTNQAKHDASMPNIIDTRSGRIRRAMITGNSAASIEAFVEANVKRGATLLNDGHDPSGD